MSGCAEETPAGSSPGLTQNATHGSPPVAEASVDGPEGSRQELVVIPVARLRSIESRLEHLVRTVEMLQSNAGLGGQDVGMVSPQTNNLPGGAQQQSLRDLDEASIPTTDGDSLDLEEFDWACLDELLRGVEDPLHMDNSVEEADESSR